MKQYEITWTPFALKCLQNIYNFILNASFSESLATRQIQRLIIRTDQLSDQPKSGKLEELLRHQGSRYLVEGSYKIIYQIMDHRVIITDVFHVKQNPKKIAKRNKSGNQ